MYYESQYHIDSRDADHRGQCRLSALLGCLQECASEAVGSLGLPRRELEEKYHGFWMLARIWVELEEPLRWDDTLTVRTWHRPSRGATSCRDFDLYREGKYVGQAVSTWVLAHTESHRLLRVDQLTELMEQDGEGLGKTLRLPHLKLPAELTEAGVRRLHYSEQDVNGHINNTRYADYACDALHMERLGPDRFIRTVQLGFLAECRAGEELTLLTGEQEGTDYVRGVGADGKARFEAALRLETC